MSFYTSAVGVHILTRNHVQCMYAEPVGESRQANATKCSQTSLWTTYFLFLNNLNKFWHFCSFWKALEPQVDHSHRLEEGLKSTAPDEPLTILGIKHLSTTARFNPALRTMLISLRARNLTSCCQARACCSWHHTMLKLGEALPKHFSEIHGGEPVW